MLCAGNFPRVTIEGQTWVAPVRNALARVFALGLIAWDGSAHAANVAFKNDLAECVAIKVREISTESNVVAAYTIVTLAKSIGECRCLSALATYTSSVDRGV